MFALSLIPTQQMPQQILFVYILGYIYRILNSLLCIAIFIKRVNNFGMFFTQRRQCDIQKYIQYNSDLLPAFIKIRNYGLVLYFN